MLCLPPQYTHEAQPLDVGVFGPLKTHWMQVCHSYFQQNPGKVLSKFSIYSLFAQAWVKSVKPENIIKKSGVYPLNPLAISVPVTQTPVSECHQDEEELVDSSMEDLLGVFTKKQFELFERRWEEQYNICTDPGNVSWL